MLAFRPLAPAFLLCCCLVGAAACATKKTIITVGAGSTTEQLILGEIAAQHLARRLPEAQIMRRFELGTSVLADAAIQAGEIDIYPEYTGAALTGVLKIDAQAGREQVRELVRDGYRRQRHCEWFGPLGFENPLVLAIAETTAVSRKVRTLSAAEAAADGWLFGLDQEYQDRPDGLPLLMRHYRLVLSAPLRGLPAGQLYPALSSGEVNIIAVRATDAALDPARFVPLSDDRNAFPAYEAGLVARTSVLQSVPGLGAALNALTGRITVERMRAMNRRVELDNAAPEVAATEFLKGAGL